MPASRSLATRPTIRPCRRAIDPATITEVTLISTIEARPVETTDAVAVTQVEKAEIVEPLLPEATAVETLEAVEPAAVAVAGRTA